MQFIRLFSPARNTPKIIIYLTILMIVILLATVIFPAMALVDKNPDGGDNLVNNSMAFWDSASPNSIVYTLVWGSVFNLIVVYLGGHIGKKRFNDRTIEPDGYHIDLKRLKTAQN